MAIDPTARVADGARLAADIEIGPYCIIGPQVELGSGVRLIAHVHIAGVTTIGQGTVIYPFVSLGGPPQSVSYRGGATRLEIGTHCDLREAVTMNTGTEDGGGVTRVGDRCLFMVGSHVGHDCQVGNAVTFANNVSLGGHVSIGDNTFLGGHAAVHQYVRIGEGAMVAGLCGVAHDLIPFGFAIGALGNLVGLNVVGLRRRGATRGEILQLRRAYRALFFGPGPFADKIETVSREFGADPRIERLLAFIRSGGKRQLMLARDRHGRDDDAA